MQSHSQLKKSYEGNDMTKGLRERAQIEGTAIRSAALLATTALTLVTAAPPVLAQDASPAAQQANGPMQLGPLRVEDKSTAGANPYADPAAPYKVDRLS